MMAENAGQQNTPLYTVLMAHYNQPKYWREAVDSVLEQQYAAIELIFADDCSKNFNPQEVKDYIEQHKRENLLHYEVFSNEYNLGTVKSLNHALELASGDFIQVMAADDVLYDETVFARSQQAFLALGEHDMAVTSCAKLYDESLTECLGEFFDVSIGFQRNRMTAQEQYRSLIFGCVYVASSTVYRREIFTILGGFDERYRLIEDAPFWCKMTKNDYRIIFCDFFGVLHRMGGVSHPTQEKITPIRKEYRMEELAFYSWELAATFPELNKDEQKRALAYYTYSKNAYMAVSGMCIIGENEELMLSSAPELVNQARTRKLKRHYEGWMRGCARGALTCGTIWVIACLLLFLTTFATAPVAGMVVGMANWVYTILPVPILANMLVMLVMWALRKDNMLRAETILGGLD